MFFIMLLNLLRLNFYIIPFFVMLDTHWVGRMGISISILGN